MASMVILAYPLFAFEIKQEEQEDEEEERYYYCYNKQIIMY
jgi:hypothetical protein